MASSHHPLQRFAAPSGAVSFGVHLAGLASFAASFRWLSKWETPLSVQYGGHYQFLTIIGLALSTVVFAVGLLADLTSSPALFSAKNALSVCATPLEVLIAVLYWGISTVDPLLLVAPGFELPLLPDLGFHLVPAVALVLDLVLVSPPWTMTGYAAMSLSTAIGFLYWGWIEFCFSNNSMYPYPLFELLSTPQRVLLFTFSAALMTLSTFALKWVYGRLNGYEEMAKTAHKPLKKTQ